MLIAVTAEQESLNSLGWFALLIQPPHLKPRFWEAPEPSASKCQAIPNFICPAGKTQNVVTRTRSELLKITIPKGLGVFNSFLVCRWRFHPTSPIPGRVSHLTQHREFTEFPIFQPWTSQLWLGMMHSHVRAQTLRVPAGKGWRSLKSYFIFFFPT